jgi:hypothetical protein
LTAFGGTHIVVAIQPRLFREALAGVLTEERPGDRIVAADPGALPPLDGALVVCSQVTPEVDALAGGWVLLRPDGSVAASSPPDVEAMAFRPGLGSVLDTVAAVATALAQLQ